MRWSAGVVVAASLGLAGPAHAVELFDPTDQDRAGRPPTFVVVPGVRLAVRYAINADTSLESYALTQIGYAGHPFVAGASGVAGGFTLSRSFGDLTWSGQVEATPSYDGLFRSYAATGLEFSTQVSRTIAIEGTPWSFGPRLSAGFRFSTDATKQRSKVQVGLPVFYKVNDALDLVLVTRVDHRYVPQWTTPGRNDIVAHASLGFRYLVRPGMQVSSFAGFENRWSSAPEVRYSRWLIIPQLSLRADF